MDPHSLRSTPPTPLRLRPYARAAGLSLGVLEGVLATEVAGVRGAALSLLGTVVVVMVLGTFAGRPLVRYLGRRRMGLFMGALAVPGAGVAAGLGGVVGLIGAGLVGLVAGGVFVVAPLMCHELSLRGHKRLMPQVMALGPVAADVVVLVVQRSPPWLFIAWVMVALAALAYLACALLPPESPAWLVRQGRDAEAFGVLCRLHGVLEASVAIDWTRLGAEMIAEQQAMSPAELRVSEVRVAVLAGAVLIIAQEALLRAAALVLAPLITTEPGLASIAIAMSAATWMRLALLALVLMIRVERLRFLRVVLGTVVAVLGVTFLVTGMTLGGVGGAWTITISLTIPVTSQSVLVLSACQGAIDPQILPWLVEAQRCALAIGGVLARAGVLLASLLIVSYLGTHALFWVAFALSVLSVAIVLLRPPCELKVQGIGARDVSEDSALSIRLRTYDLSGQVSYGGGAATRNHSAVRRRRLPTERHLSMTSNEAVQVSETTASIPESIPETMKAAVLRDYEVGLQIEALRTSRPKAGGVLIKVAAYGLCHSGLHIIGGAIAFLLPAMLGHEVSGTIVEFGLGDGYTNLTVGQKVVGGFPMPCDQCDTCTSGRDELCDPFFDLNRLKGVLYDGTTRLATLDGELVVMRSMGDLAEYAVVPPTTVAPMSDTIDMMPTTILGYAAITGYEAMRRGADLCYREIVAVVATGGMGTSIVQIARTSGASQVIVIDADDEKLVPMLDYGATAVVSPITQDAREEVFRLTGGKGADVSFEVLGASVTWTTVLDVLADGGRMVSISLEAGAQTAGVEINCTMRRLQSILGSYGARTRQGLPAIIDLADKGVINYRDIVSRHLSLEEADAGYTALRNHGIWECVVVNMSL